MDRQAPWKLAKDPALRRELDRTLAALVRQLARHAIHLQPFMPAKAAELWRQLGAPGVLAHQRFANVPSSDGIQGATVTPCPPQPTCEPAVEGEIVVCHTLD